MEAIQAAAYNPLPIKYWLKKKCLIRDDEIHGRGMLGVITCIQLKYLPEFNIR
jgi:hypothetical protein